MKKVLRNSGNDFYFYNFIGNINSKISKTMKMFLLCICLLCASFIFNSCTEKMDGISETVNSVKVLDAVTLSGNLKRSFDSATRSVDGRINYPDYYGGRYLNKDGKLVILVKGDNIVDYKDDLRARCKGDGFEIKPCVYSYNYLVDLIYYLEEKWKVADPNNDMKYYGICTDQENNKLVINTGDISEYNKNRFIELLDGFNNIEFVLSSEIEYQAEVNPAMGIAGAVVTSSTGTGYSAGSAGYRAKKGSTSVLVTSGHVLKTENTALRNRSGVEMGKCIGVKWTNISGSTVDAAICTLNSGYSLSNVVKLYSGTVTLAASVADVDQYSNISMKGYHSETTGGILATDYHVPNSNMYNFIKANYRSVSGDSGAVCYASDKKVVGIHQGALSEGGSERTIVVPAEQINRVFGLTMY